MPNIYRDHHMRVQVTDGCLDENTDYYVDVIGYSEDDVSRMFSLSGMHGMYEWLPKSNVAKIRFTNYIGKCSIGGQRFDIRSSKLLNGLSGVQQLGRLLDDISKVSGIFPEEIDSPVHVAKTIDWSTSNTNLVHELNYFYHAFFSVSRDYQIPWLFQRILANPHLDHSANREPEFVWKVVRVGNDATRNLVSGLGETVSLANCAGLIDSPLQAEFPVGKFTSLPLRISHTKYLLDSDTPENRFVKFLLEYIVIVCTRAQNAYSESQLILHRALRLETHVRQILLDPFFIHVGRIVQIPESSTVLRYRHGYKDLYEHYIKARMGVVPRFYDVVEGQVAEIKNVAILYEIWCFYMVASQILGNECLSRESSLDYVGSDLTYGEDLCNEDFRVSYNRSFTHSNSGSYSLTLRPDITVEHLRSGEIFLFDAKYRALIEFDENGNIDSKKYQSTDVHKMHTYVDAITQCRASFALYVGDSFSFFRRGVFTGGEQNVGNLTTLDGVGVVPLVPGRDRKEFEALIDRLRATR